MSAPVAALILREDGTAAIRDVEPDLATLQGLVGGYLEDVAHDRPAVVSLRWHVYADEDGRAKGLAPNPAAAAFLAALGHPAPLLVGPVVVLGETGDGDEADVPPHLVGTAVRLWGLEEPPA